ncbi:hypothetical protein BS329_38705 [Amycolatopsis coloradensis]|uniref:Uncharacterized protein n=2 Tax=Amycolatopsis coloradensis TaxID=76021 RepID=A0A1R0KEP7_9PSEU|nr:hypothetical protein BS329_38705 [Amycolatopsis coloradensis]
MAQQTSALGFIVGGDEVQLEEHGELGSSGGEGVQDLHSLGGERKQGSVCGGGVRVIAVMGLPGVFLIHRFFSSDRHYNVLTVARPSSEIVQRS